MQEVGHDFLGQGVTRLEELATDIEEEDALAVVQPWAMGARAAKLATRNVSARSFRTIFHARDSQHIRSGIRPAMEP